MFWTRARWKSSGKMIAAHSAPIRFTEVQPSCRTTRRRERNRRKGVGSGRRRWCVGGKERFWTRIGPVAAGQRWSNLIWREIKRPLGYSDLETTAALVGARIPSAESENTAVSDGRRARLRPAAASAQEPMETLLRHSESPDTTATVSAVLRRRYSLCSVGKVSGMFPLLSSAPCKHILPMHGWVTGSKEVKIDNRAIIIMAHTRSTHPEDEGSGWWSCRWCWTRSHDRWTGWKVVSFNRLIETHL